MLTSISILLLSFIVNSIGSVIVDIKINANEKSDFYELWQQHKQLKTIEMSEAGPDTFDEG